MDAVSTVEENSNDGLFPVAASGFYDESTNLFPSLNELGQTYVLDTSLSNETRGTTSKLGLTGELKSRRTQLVSKVGISVGNDSCYRRKVKRLKRIAKKLVFTNAALFDELSTYEFEISKAKQERKALLKRLFQFLPMTEAQALQSSQALKSLAPTFQGNIPPSILGPLPPSKVLSSPTESKRKKKLTKPTSGKKGKSSATKEKLL